MRIFRKNFAIITIEGDAMDVLESLARVVSPEYVTDQRASRMAYTRGVWPVELKRAQAGDWSYLPALVVWPGDTTEVAQVVQIARERRLAIVPYGGGSGIVGGTSLANALVVDLKRLAAIALNETNQTVSAGSGVNGWQLEEWLNERGYTLGHFPQSINSACVGGLVATASIGTFSGRYGKMDDLLVGLEAVLPNGKILRTRPIPRRSSGPNLTQLFIGSEGALGIITEATLRVWPKPETREWAVYTFPGTPLGLDALRCCMRTEAQPALVRLYDEAESAARIRHFGYPAGHALLILGFEGSAGYVAWQRQVVDRICADHQGFFRGDEAALHWYRYRFDTSAMLRYNQQPGGIADSLEVAAPWDRLEAVWQAMRAALEPMCDQVHCHFSHIYPTEGSAYVIFYAQAVENTPQAAIEHYQRCVQAALQACLTEGGSISHHHGIGRGKQHWMEEEHGQAGWELLRTLKQAVDPHNILNPGVMGLP
jgi:alkyldihydroxyacetonephosphate synthase